MMSALTASANVLGMIVGPMAAAADAKLSGSRWLSNEYFDAVSGKRLSKSLADIAKSYDCIAHDASPIWC